MLAVVDELAGLAIGQRGGASAKPAARLDDERTRAARCQTNRRAQPRAATANHDDVEAIHVHSHCLSAMTACSGFGTRARAVNTSWPLRSMRRSVSK